MNTTGTRGALVALVIGHIAGMIDLAGLPLWVNTLISGYGYGPAKAGLLPTSFLIGVVIASVALSRWGKSANGRRLAPIGYWIAAVAMLLVPSVRIFPVHLVLHLIGGLSIGTALSSVHRAMGQTSNPHRSFSFAGMGFGVFSLFFLGGVPQLIGAFGPDTFFYAVGVTMLCAALATTIAMPATTANRQEAAIVRNAPSPRSVLLAVSGIMGMALVQAMVFSFLVQVGDAHGFASSQIEGVLIALGVVNLFPPMLAALFDKRLSPIGVARVGSLAQGLLAVTIMLSPAFGGYAFAAAFFAGVMIFTHTFIFGFLAGQDPSGRAVAATPAMLMTGSAVAPFLGGTLVEFAGFAAVGIVAVSISTASCVLFWLAARQLVTISQRVPA